MNVSRRARLAVALMMAIGQQQRAPRAARAGGPLRLEPWTFYRDLLMCPVRVHRWRGVPLSALVVLAQTANAAGFFVEALRARLA